jgi:hypothetical protein
LHWRRTCLDGTLLLRFALAPPEVIEKRPQAGKAILIIHVMLDYVKGEVIKAAKAPDAYR